MIKQSLSEVNLVLGKSPKRGTFNRGGYRNEDGLVFLPPKNTKRLTSWKKKMQERGYTFS